VGKSQRDKGKRGELEVRDIFREAGFIECVRTPNSGGLHVPGDLTQLPDLHLEVKRWERVKIKDWIAQAQEEAPEGWVPLVAWRTSHMEWRGDIDLRLLAELLFELHTLRQERATA